MNKKLLFLLLLSSFCLAFGQGEKNNKELEYKVVNGVYCPDYVDADSVLKYIEKFKRDEGDSIHYRLGLVDRYYCPITDGNLQENPKICDSLCYFVYKLVPFREKYKEWLTKKFPENWMIEETQVFCVNGANIEQRENEPSGDLHFFFIKEKVKSK
jgi:hypothetical protein